MCINETEVTDETKPDFIIHKLERPRQGELLLVHDIGIGPLKRLARGERRLSRDGDREDAVVVYAAINRPELEKMEFACVTAYIDATFKAKSVNELYGRGSKVALIIDISKVRERLLIFNGDVGRLGKALQEKTIDPFFIQSLDGFHPVERLVSTLGMLHSNTCKIPPATPRLHANSFEGRVWEGLNPADISQIYIGNRDDKEAIDAARRILLLKEEPETA